MRIHSTPSNCPRKGIFLSALILALGVALSALLFSRTIWNLETMLVGGLLPTVLLAGFLVTSSRRAAQLLQINQELIREISERKGAEVALRESEQRYRLLFENNPHPMWVYELGTLAFLDVNQSAIQHYGYSRQEFLAMTLKDIRPPEDVPALLENIENTTAALDRSGDWRHRKKNGTLIAVEITSHALDYNGREARLVLANDITERQRAQNALRQSEKHFRSLIENISDLVCVLETDGIVRYASPSAEQLLGYTPAELIGTSSFEMLDTGSRAFARQAMAAVSNSPGIASPPAEVQARHKNGSARLLSAVGICLQREDHARIIVLTLHDITERKLAEEELRSSKARLQLQFERMPVACITWSPDHRVTSWNPAAEAIFGFTAQEALGKQPHEFLISKELEPLALQVAQRLITGESKVQMANQNLTKDGRTILCDWNNNPLHEADGSFAGSLSMVQDITEREHSEATLRASRDNLSAIFNHVNVAIFIHALDGSIVAVNKKMLDLYHVTREEAPGYSIPRDYSAPGDQLVKLPPLWQEVLGGQPHSMEWLARRPHDGSTFPVEVFLQKITWDGKEVVMAAVYDLTEQKSLEKQLLRAQRVESIGTLAAGIAHDLNNILAPIMMSAQILQLNRPGEEEAEILATIQASAKRGADIVKQVLTFARGVDGQRVILQPKHLIREIQRIAEETFPKNITFRSDAPKDLWPVTGDATQLHQVLLNLCVNARDAMPDGGNLFLKATNVQVASAKAGLFADGKIGPHVLVQISDTGHGIPPAILEKIFDPFFTTKEQGKGTGLGLSTVLGIVRSHGGFVDVQSESGFGSSFKIYLPAKPGEAALRVDTVLRPSPKGAGELILVVDDEANIRSVTQRTLTRHGYRVIVAANGKEALELMASHSEKLRAVITDIMMPVMDGLALVHNLRKSHPRLPVIACTGWGQEGVRATLQELGVESFLEKPYTSQTLLTELHQHLSGGS